MFVASSMFFSGANFASAESLPIQGYAWSDFIGWIHFSGSNYGVYENSSTGVLSGYAWSPYLGWITFNQSELSGCPSGSCQAKVSPGNGSVTGWARACGAFSDKNACSGGLDPGSGGWDGWIHLSGSGYGITSVAGSWSGYAYGSQNIGFIKFAGTASDGTPYSVGAACTNGADNPPECISCPDPLAYSDESLSCVACDGGCTGEECDNGTTNPPTCDQCPDGYYYDGSPCTACVGGCTGIGGTPSNPYGSLVCNNSANNPPTCNVFVPTASLSVDPSTIDSGESTTITWSSSYTTSCTSAGGFSTGGATSGSAETGSLTETSSYQITCLGNDGVTVSSPAITTVTVLQPEASITANPERVQLGSNSTISWTINDVKSCDISKNGEEWKSDLSSSGSSVDNSITTQTIYTIDCKSKGSAPDIVQSTIVNKVPLFIEF